MYGYTDTESVTPGASGGKFGLNSGVLLTKFEFNALAGKDKTAGEAIDVTIQIGEKEFYQRFFPISKVFSKEGGEITDVNSNEYKEEFAKANKMQQAMLIGIVECFVSSEDVKMALSTPISSFKAYAEILERLVKSNPDWNKTPIDVFLQYQWAIKGENKQTFLELPKNLKHGIYVTKSLGTGFTEAPGSSLKYVNEEGVTHPFKRSEWFKESPFANVTKLEETPTPSMSGGGTNSNGW